MGQHSYPFPGVEKAFAAFTGGGATEQLAALQEDIRLTQARSQQALLDDRISKAALTKSELDATNQLRGLLDPNNPFDVSVLAGLAAQMANRGLGVERNQQNIGRQALFDQLLNPDGSLNIEGAIDPDVLNAVTSVISGTKLGPGNVRVTDQADADILADTARAAASEASAVSRTASAKLSDRRREVLKANELGQDTKFSLPSKDLIELLLPPDLYDDDEGRRLTEFNIWWAKQREIDPAYNNGNYALIQFDAGIPASPRGRQVDLSELGQRNLAASQPQGADSAPLAGEVKTFTAADAQVVIAAAERAIQSGKDPDIVKQRLEAKLKEMGFSLQ